MALLVGVLPAVVILVNLARSERTAPAVPRGVAFLLGEAERANAAHDIESEQAALEKAEQVDGSREDFAEVQRRLAVVAWKYHGRFEDARERLLRATKAADPAKAWLSLARMEQSRGRFEAAREAAIEARGLSDSALDEEDALTALARANVAEAVERRLEGKRGVSGPLRESLEHLRVMVGRDPGHLEPSRLLLRAALLVDDGPTALSAWRSYFHVAPGGSGPNLVSSAGRDLERLLSDWAGPNASLDTRVGLIRALAASRLFAEAAVVALDPASPHEVREKTRVRAVIGYVRFLRDVRALTEEHYRQTILGSDRRDGWQAALSEASKPLVALLAEESPANSPAGSRPPVDPRRAGSLGTRTIDLLSEHFGAYVSIGETAGFLDLHMGHRILDETRIVEQYGHRAELRFVVLDNMVSNGFQSWAWESGAQHGGWNKPYGIYQVRPAYAGGSLEAWRRLHSDDELADQLEEMERESALDEERAVSDPHAYLPGLAMRLRHQGETRLRDRLRSEAEGDALRLAFIAAYDRAVQESSIFAHEGRHAIDKREGELLSFMRNAEFTAKLAEVAFAPEPRLALGAIISPTIGDSTPHGKANLAIMKGLVRWMRVHANEIVGLDVERPLLPQLDLLTDEQLRVAFRSMDRLAGAA